jgi:hypothetical protein
MRPKHSLNHNIKSVPLVLTGNNLTFVWQECCVRTLAISKAVEQAHWYKVREQVLADVMTTAIIANP